MTKPSYSDMHPEPGEALSDYIRRLEADGHEEMFIRKALRRHYGLEIHELAKALERFEGARLRHVALLKQISPTRSDYSMIKKIEKNLGLTEAEAQDLLSRFKEKAAPS